MGGTPFLETTCEYDILDRMVRTVTESGTLAGPSANPVIEYRYDRNSNRVLVTNPIDWR